MPTYDYLCAACGHAFEEFQTMSAKPLRKCPECSKRKLERLIGAGAGVIFKGSGFYGTDYRGGGYSADAKKDTDAPTGGCRSKCGTPDAPKDCPMAKKKD